jgi:hypothetical protein
VTEKEFIAEAKRRGKSREETLRKFRELKAAGAFSDSSQPASRAPADPDIPAVPPEPMQAAPEQASAPAADWRQQADAIIPDWMGEFAAAANREVTEVLDFLGPDGVNAVLSLAGSNRRVPTLASNKFGAQGVLGQDGANTGIEGGFMQPGVARDAVQTAGALTAAAGGFKSVPRSADKIGSVLADFAGAGSSAVTAPVRNAAPYVEDLYRRAMPDSPVGARARRQAELPLKRREGTSDTFGFKLDEGTGRVVADPRQAAAAKQGVDERVVTMLRDAPPKAREKMRAMLDVVDQSRKDALFEAGNRPSDIVGESITKRTRAILAANRTAAKQLDEVANALKGQSVDAQPAVQQFLDDIADMGVQFDPASRTVRYEGSDIEDVEGATRVINSALKRLYNSGKPPDAYDVHRMKRWIDERVAYGKAQEGLTGNASRLLKSLRHNLDGILDAQFPEYNRINTNYSETIGALNTLQDAAGKRIDLTGKNAETALGTLSRRVLGNVVSRQNLINALDEVDQVAQDVVSGRGAGQNVVPYRGRSVSELAGVTADDLDDSLIGQIRFVSELEKIFGTNASNSFMGDIAKATDRTAESLAVGDKTGPMREGARMVINKMRGVNEENALKALRELLKD